MERARSFGTVAEAYDRYRPALPDAVATWWRVGPGRRVVDVAAGTGLATRTFERAGARVIAVEPDDAMRAVLSRRSPDVDARAGTSEAIPLQDAAADVVTVVSAWHWVDPVASFHEAARVLRDGGTLGIGWHGADRQDAWAGALFDLRRRGDSHRDDRAHSPDAVVLPAGAPFEDVAHEEFAWSWTRSIDEIVEWTLTYSGTIVAGEAAAQATRDAVRALVTSHADTTGRVQVPMRARCWRATRVAR